MPQQSRLERVQDDWLAALYRRDKQVSYEMAKRYRQAVKALVPLYKDAYARLQAAKAAGYDADYLSGFIWNEQRLARLLVQAVDLFTAAGADTGLILSRGLVDSAKLAQMSAANSIGAELALTAGQPVVGTASFTTLPQQRFELAAARMSDGSPIVETFAKRYGTDGPLVLRKTLIEGIVAGDNPVEVARRMSKALGEEYGKMALVARTEMLQTYRLNTLKTYQANSKLVRAWRWSAALQDSTCPVCWAMHGKIFPLTEPMATHPCCRCSMRPVLKPWSEIDPRLGKLDGGNTPERGVTLFAKQTEATQKAVLGPLKYKAYKEGLIDLPDLVQETWSDDYGKGRRERSLISVIGPDKYGKLRKPVAPAPLPKPKPVAPAGPTKPVPLGRIPLPKQPPKPTPAPIPKAVASPIKPKAKVPPPAPPPLPVRVPGKPKGVPVTKALNTSKIARKSAVNKSVVHGIDEAMASIDKVHGDGTLPELPVTLFSDNKGGKRGHYKYGRRYSDRKYQPVEIGMSRAGDCPATTMAHEVGHFLDQQWLGNADQEITDTKQTPVINAWRSAVYQSRAYKGLQDYKRLPAGQKITWIAEDGTTRQLSPPYEWLDYTTKDNELFARSYAQYIATRSQNPTMLGEIDRLRDPTKTPWHNAQWAEDDFEPIALAFDDIFKEYGGIE